MLHGMSRPREVVVIAVSGPAGEEGMGRESYCRQNVKLKLGSVGNHKSWEGGGRSERMSGALDGGGSGLGGGGEGRAY